MYLAVDIGGTKTLVGVLDTKGKVVDTVKFPTPKTYETFLSVFRSTYGALSSHDITKVAVAAPGFVDRDNGIVTAYGNLNWKNTPLRKDIEHIVGAPTLLDNDANLAGLSEAVLIKKDFKRVLYVTISTGIGTGIITNGIIDPHFSNSEGGHMMLEHNGKLIEWEEFASGRAIKNRFGKQASEIKDEKTWKTITHDLAKGFLNLIAVTQPDAIVIGGGVGTHFDKFDDLLQAALKKYETPLTPTPPILRAQRPEEAVLHGCFELIKLSEKR